MIYLERHSEDDNLHRFYAMAIRRDLFATWVLDRRWGRVGIRGAQSLVESDETQADALDNLGKLDKLKRRRGYAPEVVDLAER